MLDDDALRVAEDGLELDVHLNWYRSLPLSSLKTVDLTIDGESIGRDEMTIVVNGSEHELDALADRWEEMWFVLDPATLRVRGAGRVKAGDEAVVTIRLGNRIPYILIGPDQALEYVTERTKTLVAQ
jgi:hypothetical protein